MPATRAFPPLVRPYVEDVVEVKITEQRRNYRTLRGSRFRRCQRSIFHYASFEPFADQADYPLIADALFYETDEPIVAHRIEECADVSVKNPVYPRLVDPYPERIKGVVLAPPWA